MSKPSDAPKTGVDLSWRFLARNPAATGAAADWGDALISDLRAALGISIPTLATLTFSATNFSTAATAGSLITTITGKTSGSTLAISPNDGRIVFNSDQSAILVGSTASSAGTIAYTITETLAGATGSPKSTALSLTALTYSGVSLPFTVGVNIQGMDSGSRDHQHLNDIEGQQFTNVTKANMQYLVDRGVTYARLPLMPERLFTSIGQPLNTAYATIVQRVLTDAASVGLKIIIDMHGYCSFWSRPAVTVSNNGLTYSASGLGASGVLGVVQAASNPSQDYWLGGANADANGNASVTLTSVPTGSFYYTASYSIGAANCLMTIAEFKRQVGLMVQAFKGYSAVVAWSYNEPTGVENSATLLPQIMSQGWYAGITDPAFGNDKSHAILVMGNNYGGADTIGSLNPGYPIADPYNLVTYEVHAYSDPDKSGNTDTWPTWASVLAAGGSTSAWLARLQNAIDWKNAHNVRLMVGEIGMYSDSASSAALTAALDSADAGIALLKAAGIPVFAWHYGPAFGASPHALFPYTGVEQPQWNVIRYRNTAPNLAYRVSGPDRANPGVTSSVFTESYTGRLNSPVVITPAPKAGVTYNPATQTLPANTWGPSATFTVTDSSGTTFNLNLSNNGGMTDPTVQFSTAPQPGGATNLIMTQNFQSASWIKNGACTVSDYVDPADGVTYTRLQMQGDYPNNLAYNLGTHVAGNQTMEFKTLGSNDMILNFFSGSLNGNFDFSTGNNPKNTWVAISKPLNANAPFTLMNRNVDTDILIRKAYAGTGTYT